MSDSNQNTGELPVHESLTVVPPNSEVKPKQARKRHTAAYKLRILEALDRCNAVGEKGALIRREGLYSSQITDWRRQRDAGALSALNKVRGRKKQSDARDQQIKILEQQVAKLESKLLQAETIIDVQKKVSEIFGISNPSDESSEKAS